MTDKCTPEEDREFAAMCNWLRANRLKLVCRYTARRKPKEVKLLFIDKRNRRTIASA